MNCSAGSFALRKLFVLLIPVLLLMQSGLTKADKLFKSTETLNVEIAGPFLKLNRQRDKSQSYAATLASNDNSFDVTLRVRGNKRLDPLTCRYPPLRIDFDAKQIKKTLYSHQKSIKLVVLCKDTQQYRDYLRSEFLIYRMLNTLTPLSYQVRWANVTYLNEKGKARTQPAFFIERKSRLAKRNNLSTTSISRIRPSELEANSSALVGLFQYMVSNADYSLVSSADDSCCHNAKLLSDEGSQYWPVIYDFDSSGLVNAKYAVPNPALKIKKVTRRLYRGYCRHNTEVSEARSKILDQRATLLAQIELDEHLTPKASRKMAAYLTESFDKLSEASSWQKEILDNCRG